MPKSFHFQFGGCSSSVTIQEELPKAEEFSGGQTLLVCDENTRPLALKMGSGLPLVVLSPGEDKKNWEAVETILSSARSHGMGRDGLFIGIGGGVVCDLTGFAASIYMRGAALALVPTTLLCMVDAAVGGKTGFDLGGQKNLAGTFYPADRIFIAADALDALPRKEWKSGIAELIKTAVLDRDPDFFSRLRNALVRGSGALSGALCKESRLPQNSPLEGEELLSFIERAVRIKGAIVEADPRETGTERALLNLGHSFGHALESSLGLGALSHGEAVAWGMARSCELGRELGITPPRRAEAIMELLHALNYETSAPYPLPAGGQMRAEGKEFREALFNDKKKKAGLLRFVVPASEGARLVGSSPEVEAYLEKLLSKLALS